MPQAIPLIIGLVVSTVVSVAIKLVASALTPKPKPPQLSLDDRLRGTTITARQPIGHWRIGYGEFRAGGLPVYMGTSESNGKFHVVAAQCAHEVDSFVEYLIGEQWLHPDDLDASGLTLPDGPLYFSGNSDVRIQTKLGTADQTAFAALVAESSNGEWSADHRARGHALLYVRYKYHPTIFPGGLPNQSAVMRGRKVYDPRDGQTRWTPNAALCIRDFLLRPKELGGYGMESVDETNFAAAANVCDEIVASATTGAAAVVHTAQSVAFGGNDGVASTQIQSGGFYTADPSGTDVALTGGSGAGAKATVTATDPIGQGTIFQLAAATITDRGAGYAAGDVLTVPGAGTTGTVLVTRVTSSDHIAVDGEYLKFQVGDRVEIASTGSLPGGLSAATPYYAIPRRRRASKIATSGAIHSRPALSLAASYAAALAGTQIELASAGSGTITLTKTGEPRYTINGSYTTDQSPRKVLEELLTACGGRVPEGAGAMRLMGLAWAAPTLTLDEDDLRGPLKVQTRRPGRDRFNTVRGTYVSPLNDYQPSDYPAVSAANYVSADGEPSAGDYAQPFTSRPGQAQRVAKIELVRNRFERTVQFPALLTGYDCKVGENVAITNARRVWAAKPFELLEWKPRLEDAGGGAPYLGVDLVGNENAASVYDWSSSEERAPGPVIAPTLPNWSAIPPPGAPNVAEALYEGRDGSDVKARVTLTWVASPSGLVEFYDTEFKPSSGGDSAWVAFAPPTNQAVLTADRNDVAPAMYDFRARGRSSLGAVTAWSTTSNKVVFGLEADPVAITNLTGQTLGGQFVLRWDLHADADVRRGGQIEFRHTPTVSGSTAAETTTIGDAVDGRSTQAVLPFKDGTYYARAVDKLGNAGPWASVSTIGSTVLAWSTIGSIQEDATFPGTHAGTAVAGSALTIDGSTPIDSWGLVDSIVLWDAEGGIATSGTYTFSAGIDLGSVQRVRMRSHVLCSIVNILDLIDSRAGNIDDWESFDGTTAPGAADAWVEVRATNDDPAGAPTWSSWQRLDVAEFASRAFQFRAQLRSHDTAYRPEVTQLRAYAEDPSL